MELLDPLTGAVKTTLPTPYAIALALAFSSDGRYLAASYSNDQHILVWQISTRTVVFQQTTGQYYSLAWQPGTHNLAGAPLYPIETQLWNIDTQKLSKTYPGVSAFTWSPDGKELATYTTLMFFHMPGPNKPATNQVIILDAATGAPIATYKSPKAPIFDAVWSPDGRYIVTVEASSVQNENLIRVWVA